MHCAPPNRPGAGTEPVPSLYASRSGGGGGRSARFQGPGRAFAPEHTGRSDGTGSERCASRSGGGDGRLEPFRPCPVPPNRPGAGTEPVPSLYASRSGGGGGRSDPFRPCPAPEHTGRSDGGDGRFEPFRQCPVPPNRPGAGTEPVPSLYPSRSAGGVGRSDPFGPFPAGVFKAPAVP